MVLKGQGPLSKGVSGVIGLATEAYSHHKESSKGQDATTAVQRGDPNIAPQEHVEGAGASSDDSSDNEDEEDWIRDEMETQLEPLRATEDSRADQSVDQMVEAFTRKYPPPSYNSAVGRLPCAVIIPQRPPETNRRGFVAAYAPVLNDCGINEKMFMEFHQGFYKSTNKQGWFNVVNVAVAISVLAETAAVAPSVIVHVTAFCVHASIEAGRRLYVSHSTNKFLDSMNEKLFKPHGLYAMIMSYKPGTSKISENFDVNANVNLAVDARLSGGRSNFRASSGKTRGGAQMPEAAPLVFPLLRDTPDAEKANAFKRAANFTGDYTDRRAQAKFEAEHPDAVQLAGAPRKEFASRWADPNHSVNQGGLLNVLSGGAINPRARLQQKHDYRASRTGRTPIAGRHKDRDLVGNAKRSMHEDVLYLMVVNMPSEEELKAAAEIMDKAKRGGFGAQLQAMMAG